MPDRLKYNLRFQPASYWDVPESLLARIKGDERKDFIRLCIANGQTEEIPPVFFRDSLPKKILRDFISESPMTVGGELLPDFDDGEVEIARVVRIESTRHVFSLRASKHLAGLSGVIRYKIVDEQGTSFNLHRLWSNRPLLFDELIRLIDRATYPDGRSLIERCHELIGGVEDARVALNSFRVTSDFYPDLQRWYQHVTAEWIASAEIRRLAKLDPNTLYKGAPLLHWAWIAGDVEFAANLIQQGVDIERVATGDRRQAGQTALHTAAAFGSAQLVSLLLRHGANVNAATPQGITPLNLAISGRRRAAVRLLTRSPGVDLDAAEDDGRTALHFAAAAGSHSIVRLLLEHGADPNTRSVFGESPLHHAADHGNVGLVDVLIDHGADPHARTSQLHTPAHAPAQLNHAHVLQRLLARGADPNLGDDDLWTPLRTAAEYGSKESVIVLLDGGADINALDEVDWTPLDAAIAFDEEEVAEILRSRGGKHGREVLDEQGVDQCAGRFRRNKIKRLRVALDKVSNRIGSTDPMVVHDTVVRLRVYRAELRALRRAARSSSRER